MRPTKVVLQDGSRLSTIQSLEDADAFVAEVRALGAQSDRDAEVERLRTLVIAQTPKAVKAQIEMDKHKHGYHNREKRLYELIDFNDSFVSYVLATRHEDLPGLETRLFRDMNEFCRRLGVLVFTQQQYDAIVRGLSREIAVYRTAKYHGYQVSMTSRTEDAFGIDMKITDRESGKTLNVDCKTPAAFRHRLEDLVHHGRISDDELLQADERGFLTLMQHRGQESVPVTLFCVLPDRLGEISNFTFDEPERLKTMLETMFRSA